METVWTLLTHLLFLHLAKGSVTNVARNKPASMSSNHGSFKASTAVDGNTTAVYPGGVIHTATRQSFAWWKVDLERDVQDATVEIYFRTDSTRRNGVRIYTSTTPFSSYPEGQLCYTVTRNPSGSDIDDVVSVTCPGRWRYLLVYTNTDNDRFGPILDFGEVMVLVCSPGTYGSSCSQLCSDRHCLNSSASCNAKSGSCDGDCRSGWWQADCTQVCQTGVYGVNCLKTCSSRHCVTPSSECDRQTGQCIGGCQEGWRGVDCTQACSDGTYGENCTKTCNSRHCVTMTTTCERDGRCPGGCQTGWTGEDCTQVCGTGNYGPNCTKLCSSRHCSVTSSSCAPVNGSCRGGVCQAGWRGTDCAEECQTGMYGVNCMKSCSSRHCVTSSSECDRQTGQCYGGCQEGWRGVDCSQVCSPGTYGSSCSQLCSARHCLNSVASCNATSGSCDGECISGWWKADCTQECQTGMYGVNCMKSCSSRHCVTPSSECDHQTGQCIGGCQEGWRSDDCTQVCLTGMYGVNCMKSCSSRHCMTPSPECERQTGQCIGGCEEGWRGDDCAQECPSGTFGVRCTNCSTRHCQGDSDCQADGRCSQGCQDGWALINCTQVCPPGSYGSGCNKTCGNCSADRICDHVTGYCSEGCEPGWMSERCDKEKVTQEKPDVIVPAVAGAVGAVLVIMVVVVVVVLFKRRKKSQEGKSSTFQDDIQSKRSEHFHDSNMYVNVAMEIEDKSKIVNPQGHKTPHLPQRSSRDDEDDQSEEILDEDDAPSTSAYYNISESEVIREITVEDLEATIQKIQHREGGFEAEYSRLPTGFMSTYADSQKEENAGKNKFLGYYPYDHNRVRLSSIPDIPGSDYINASFIHSYDQSKTYIAAQAPNKKIVGDFWRMIWEQRCGRVVMLTGLVERAKVKCYQYWPKKDIFTTDYFRIEMEVSDTRADFTVRTMKLTKLETGECRTVVQYHYTTWPDHDVPDTLSLVNFIWMIRRTDTETDGPLLVHCSAGIGRTGTYIAVDSLLDQARGEGKVDVLGCVSAMREERKNMIQTKEQYECVFHCLLEMTQYGTTSLDVNNFTNIYSKSGMNGRVDGKTFRKLVTMMLSEKESGLATKNRLWVDGFQDFLVRTGPSLRNLRGHLLAVSPSPGLEKLLWQLVEENNVHNIIVISQIQIDLAGDKGQTRNVGNFKVTTVGQTNLTSDVSHVTLQLQVPNVDSKLNIKMMKFQGTISVEMFSSFFLEHAHLKVMSAELESSVIVHSEADRKLAVTFCVMRNILSEIMEDQQVDVISQVKKFTKCFPDVNFTQSEVEKLFDFAKKCVQMTASTYANM